MSELSHLPDRASRPSVLDTLASEAYGATFPAATSPAAAPEDGARQAAEQAAALREGADLSDAPEMVALTHMPFEARAQWMDEFADLEPTLSAMQGRQRDEGGSLGDTARDAAAMYRVLGRLEKLLRGAAADPQVWDAWPGRFDETKLLGLFGRYMEAFQVPEASSSSS